jgi:hypothetical protein
VCVCVCVCVGVCVRGGVGKLLTPRPRIDNGADIHVASSDEMHLCSVRIRLILFH